MGFICVREMKIKKNLLMLLSQLRMRRSCWSPGMSGCKELHVKHCQQWGALEYQTGRKSRLAENGDGLATFAEELMAGGHAKCWI